MADYRPFDQEEWLGLPPYSPEDPTLINWERAHGHDVRLKCYPEFGCLVIEAGVRAEVAEEIARAIEVTQGRRCPECGGLPASLKWSGAHKRLGRCGAGHTWTAEWRDAALIAREHAEESHV